MESSGNSLYGVTSLDEQLDVSDKETEGDLTASSTQIRTRTRAKYRICLWYALKRI